MKTMNCGQLEKLLDAYLDSELDAQTKASVDEHAAACPACGELLDSAMRLMTRCAEMDEGLSVPLDVQASWRAAVRTEAARGKPRRGVTRWATPLVSVAAALVVLVGGTMMMQNNPASLSPANGAPTGYIARTAAESGAVKMMAMDEELGAGAVYDQAPMYETDSADVSDSVTPTLPVPGDEPSGASADVRQQKVIKSASRSIETSNFEADLQVIRNLVESDYEGLVDDYSEYNPKKAGRDEFRNAYLNVRIPTDTVEEFLGQLDEQLPVVSRNENAQTITTQYYDVSARLEQQKGLLQDLHKIGADAVTVEERIQVQQQIREAQAEIESMQGQIRSWDSRIDYTQVYLNVQEVADKNLVQPIDGANLGERIRASFTESINLFSKFVQDMAVFIVLVWPWLVLLIAVIIIVSAGVRRRRKNR